MHSSLKLVATVYLMISDDGWLASYILYLNNPFYVLKDCSLCKSLPVNFRIVC